MQATHSCSEYRRYNDMITSAGAGGPSGERAAGPALGQGTHIWNMP